MRFQANLVINSEMILDTGLRIGGSSDSVEIGGIDNPVIRDSRSDLPYIPGSSSKGKMRSLSELSDSDTSKNVVANGGNPCKCGKCNVCIVYGTASKDINHGPTRLIIRDAFPTLDTIEIWKNTESVVRGTEIKPENTINRLTSEANPRAQQERVPRDSRFNIEMIYSIYEDEDYNRITIVLSAMKLLEDNYLGGSGTRGYGKVRFDNIQITKRNLDYYRGINENISKVNTGNTIEAILKDKELINKLKIG